MLPSEPQVCSCCGKDFARLAQDGLCWTCLEKAEAARALREASAATLENLAVEVEKRLRKAGFEERELDAKRDMIPPEVRRALPKEGAEAMRDGHAPPAGWGMVGSTGIGKTMAVAALCRAYAEAVIRRRAPIEGTVGDDIGLEWVAWPQEADWMRNHGTEVRALAPRVERLSSVPVLVLDDLARERRKSHYSEDWALGKLDLIIASRSRRKLPTIWTCNVGAKALVEVYGAALVSRLCGENPPVDVQGKDLRIG